MGRTLRSYQPGSFYHICGRTQARVHWFTDEVKHGVVRIISDAVEGSDVALLAFVVMDNHFHLIVQQGEMALGSFMQPVMRRTAVLAKTVHGLEDHLFGGRYRNRTCADPSDLRNCIRYVHRNPVRAGVCEDPIDYPWSSHIAYARQLPASVWRPRLTVVRNIFARGVCRSNSELANDYLAFMKEEPQARTSSTWLAGDRYGAELFGESRRDARKQPRRRRDLRDVVLQGIRELCPELDLESVRTFRGALMSRIRAELIRRAALEGYAGCRISRYLQVSESQVSRVIKKMPALRRIARDRHV